MHYNVIMDTPYKIDWVFITRYTQDQVRKPKAYDVEENGWRSFRVASVKSFLLPSYFEWSPETQDMGIINSVKT